MKVLKFTEYDTIIIEIDRNDSVDLFYNAITKGTDSAAREFGEKLIDEICKYNDNKEGENK